MRHPIALAASIALIVPACSGGPSESEGTGELAEAVGEFDTELPKPRPAPGIEPDFGIDPQPVQVGLDGPDFDACGSFGVITGLNPDGDNFLVVRAAPDVAAEELDRITTDTGVWLCDGTDGWIGVVYGGAGREDADCNVGSPVSTIRAYSGSCRAGWVSDRYVQLIAG